MMWYKFKSKCLTQVTRTIEAGANPVVLFSPAPEVDVLTHVCQLVYDGKQVLWK